MMVISLLAEGGRGQMRQRTEVPAAHQWKLEDLYPSDDAWHKAKGELGAGPAG